MTNSLKSTVTPKQSWLLQQQWSDIEVGAMVKFISMEHDG